MASLSADLKLVLLALGEEGYGAYTNYGDVENANWEIVEDKLGGQSAISVTTADVTLTDAQQQTLHLNLSGLLTGNRSIILKASQKGLFFVTNSTTGAYTITIKPSAGSGVVLDQGKRAWIYSDGSTATFITKLGDLLSQETITTDANFTLTWGTNAESIRYTGVQTADRDVTLSTTGAVDGARWRITHAGSGGFLLNIGTGPLKALGTNMWAEFVYDGSAWYLDKHGFTNMSAFAQTFLDDADAAAVRATLGISAGAEKQVFSSSGTYTKPAQATLVIVQIWGGGAGGGSGKRNAAGSNRAGGAGGGGGGYVLKILAASDVAATETVTIGVGGTGAAAITADNTDGVGGGAGGNSTFGTLVTAYGGAGGSAVVGNNAGGGGGGGTLSAGSTTTGGGPGAATTGADFGGGSGTNNADGAATVYGGAAGGGNTTGVAYQGGTSFLGGCGGGSGGPISNGNVSAQGQAGGGTGVAGGGGAAGTVNGGNGGNAATARYGGGGGGAGNSAGGAAGNGGNGLQPGGGGGGGGGSLNGSNSGAGGNGGAGYCIVYTI